MKITVNGQHYSVTDDKPLLSVLREEIGMLSVKEGCDDATCGTCVVIAGGKLVKSCSRKTSTFENQEITTTEGLSEREKEVYVEAFGESGAVQCGFCIPGMVMAGKVLLDKNPDPTREEVSKGIRLDVCRCTGYKKVEEAILFDDPNPHRHPLTRYVCHAHFRKIMGPEADRSIAPSAGLDP